MRRRQPDRGMYLPLTPIGSGVACAAPPRTTPRDFPIPPEIVRTESGHRRGHLIIHILHVLRHVLELEGFKMNKSIILAVLTASCISGFTAVTRAGECCTSETVVTHKEKVVIGHRTSEEWRPIYRLVGHRIVKRRKPVYGYKETKEVVSTSICPNCVPPPRQQCCNPVGPRICSPYSLRRPPPAGRLAAGWGAKSPTEVSCQGKPPGTPFDCGSASPSGLCICP